MYYSFTDYIKKSFKTIFKNKVLLFPLLFELLLAVVPATLILSIIKSTPYSSITPFIHEKTGFIVGLIIGGITMIILYLSIFAGKLNMLKKATLGNKPNLGHFKEGIKKYTVNILLGNFMIFCGAILLLLPLIPIALLIPIKLLLVVLYIIPLFIFLIFISFWSSILVYEDFTPMESLKASCTFVKKHFGLVLVLNILRGILTGSKTKGRTQRGRSFNMNYYNFDLLHLFNMPSLGFLWSMAIITLVLKSFFSLYFDTLFLLVYHDRRERIIANTENLNIDSDY